MRRAGTRPADDLTTELLALSHRLTPVALTAAIVLLAPVGAHAAVLNVEKRCFRGGNDVTVFGRQFTPNGPASVSVDDRPQPVPVTVKADGTFTTTVSVPRFKGSSLGPRTFTVSAIDSNPENTAIPISVWAVRRMLATNAPIAGRSTALTTWRFVGFRPEAEIYGHFRFRGVTHRNYLFGRAQKLGPCGALTVRAPRLPLRRLREGLWRLQIDNAAHYSAGTTPRTIVRFQVFRRMGA